MECVDDKIEISARWHIAAVGFGVNVLPPHVSVGFGVVGVEDVDHPG